MAKQKKVSKAQQLKIYAYVVNFLVMGVDESRIKKATRLKYDVSIKYVGKMIRHVLNEWAYSAEENMRAKRQRAILSRKKILATAWATGNHKLALDTEDSLTHIEGTRYDAMIADDNDIRFEVTVKQSKKDAAKMKDYEDELENPGNFEKRQNQQIKAFMEKYDEG